MHECKLLQSCPTLCSPRGCNLTGSSVHGILQARILEWVAIPYSRGSSQRGMEPKSPALQADSLPFEHQGSLEQGCCSVIKSCLTFCDPMDCSTPGFPVFTSSQSLLKLMSIETVMPSNQLNLCCPLLLQSIRVCSVANIS